MAGSEGQRSGNLHFCGEHTSTRFQGYMEGAAATGADVGIAIAREAVRAQSAPAPASAWKAQARRRRGRAARIPPGMGRCWAG